MSIFAAVSLIKITKRPTLPVVEICSSISGTSCKTLYVKTYMNNHSFLAIHPKVMVYSHVTNLHSGHDIPPSPLPYSRTAPKVKTFARTRGALVPLSGQRFVPHSLAVARARHLCHSVARSEVERLLSYAPACCSSSTGCQLPTPGH